MAEDGNLVKADDQHDDMEKYRNMLHDLDDHDIPSNILEKIASNPEEHAYTRMVALQHRSIQPEVAARLAEKIASNPEEDHGLRQTVLSNQYLPPKAAREIAEKIASNPKEDIFVRQNALNNEHLSPEIAGKIAAQIASNPKEHLAIRHFALAHHHLPPEIAGKIAAQIASNPHEDTVFRENALSHEHLPSEIASELAEQIASNPHEDEDLRATALGHEHLHPEIAGKIAEQIASNKKERKFLRMKALFHRSLPPEIAGKIAEQIASNPKEDHSLREQALSYGNLSSNFLQKFTQTETDKHLLEAAGNNSNHPQYSHLKALKEAHKLWRDYESSVDPSHFAAVKTALTGQKHTAFHRGEEGSPDNWENAIPHLKAYAAAVQKKVAESAHFLPDDAPDPIPDQLDEESTKGASPWGSNHAKDDKPYIKNIKGIPHVFVMRGVAGDYASSISDSLGIDENNQAPDTGSHDGAEVPMQAFQSWTTSPGTAHWFANRDNAPGGRGAGVVIKKWLPLKDLLHSGHHDVFPGQDHYHTGERELVFAHPDEKLHIGHEDIMSLQNLQDNTFSRYKPPATPEAAPKAPKQPEAAPSMPKQPEAAPAMPKAPEPKMAKAEADTPPLHDEIDRLLKHPDPVERRLALKLYNVNSNHIVNALKHHQDPELRRALIFHPSSDDSVLSHIVQNPGSNEELKWLADHPYFFGNGHAANLVENTCNPLGPCDKDRLQAVCDIVCRQQTLLDPSLLVNLVSAVHTHLPDRVQHVLSHASANGKVFDKFFDTAISDPNGSNPMPDLQAQFIADPRVCPEVVGRAFDLDPGHPLRMHALSSPHAPRPHIDNALIGLFVYPNDPRGPYVAKNPTLTSGDLDRLLSCANETIQDIAMQHPSLDESHAKKVQSIKEGRAFNQQSVQKSEDNLTFKQDHADSEILRHMHGFRPHLDRVFEAARFMVGAPVASMEIIRRALWKADGDPEAAAFFAYNLEDTERNRRALKAIMELQDCEKAESEQEIKGQVLAVHPNSQSQANEIERAFQSGQVVPVRLNGKHSQGSMVAQDPNSHTSYLLKPGSGAQSPAAGAREDPSSQAQREAAFWAVANLWGLGDSIPRCDLLFIDGQQYACISLLNEDFRSVQVTRKENPGFVKSVFDSYRNQGLLHKWATIDYILGNPDRHADNLMINKDGKVILIDHGSAFCGASFDPGFDQNSFVPVYLRHRAPANINFSAAPAQDKMRYMEPAPADKKEELAQWVMGLNAESLKTTLSTYYVDPAACVERLHELQTLVAQGEPVDEAINRLWVGT